MRSKSHARGIGPILAIPVTGTLLRLNYMECIDVRLLHEIVRLRHVGQGHPLVVGVGIAP